MEINDRQLDEIPADFSAVGQPAYLDDPALGFGHAALDQDDLGIPRFSPDLPRVPVALIERHQALWTHPDNPTPRQEVWTELALAHGMQRIGPRGVHRLPNLDGWLLGEWPRDGGGLQLQQPDGTLFVYALCALAADWIAAARHYATVRSWCCTAHTWACASPPATPAPNSGARPSWPPRGLTGWSPAGSSCGDRPP